MSKLKNTEDLEIRRYTPPNLSHGKQFIDEDCCTFIPSKKFRFDRGFKIDPELEEKFQALKLKL